MNFILKILSTVCQFSLLIILFDALCIVCDCHLIPIVDVFIKQFHLSEEFAAVTLVAFGSAAPELFLNSIGAITKTSDLSLSAILGSGMIAFGLIPPLCFISIMIRTNKKIYLKVYPIIRECTFYVLGLLLFFNAIKDGEISMIEAIGIVSVYAVYVSTVILSVHLCKRNDCDETLQPDNINPSAERTSNAPTSSFSNYCSDLFSGLIRVNSIIMIPLQTVFQIIIPSLHQNTTYCEHFTWTNAIRNSSIPSHSSFDINFPSNNPIIQSFSTSFRNSNPSISEHDEVKQSQPQDNHGEHSVVQPTSLVRAFAALIASIIYIGVLATCIVSACEALVINLNIGSSMVGATLVALGAEIPDTISAISLAKSGYHDGAMAGAIGSQVINISLGVGLPALLVCLSGRDGGYLKIAESDSLWRLTCMLSFVILTYISVTLPFKVWYYSVINTCCMCGLADKPSDGFYSNQDDEGEQSRFLSIEDVNTNRSIENNAATSCCSWREYWVIILSSRDTLTYVTRTGCIIQLLVWCSSYTAFVSKLE